MQTQEAVDATRRMLHDGQSEGEIAEWLACHGSEHDPEQILAIARGSHIKALVIPTKGDMLEVELAGDDQVSRQVQQLHTLVGGHFETVPYPGRRDVVVWVNEDGKRQHLKPNVRATFLLREQLGHDDYVAGDVVITGRSGPETTSCPIPLHTMREALG